MTNAPPPAIDNARWVADVVTNGNHVTMYSEREGLDDAVKHIIEMLEPILGTEFAFSMKPYERA